MTWHVILYTKNKTFSFALQEFACLNLDRRDVLNYCQVYILKKVSIHFPIYFSLRDMTSHQLISQGKVVSDNENQCE